MLVFNGVGLFFLALAGGAAWVANHFGVPWPFALALAGIVGGLPDFLFRKMGGGELIDHGGHSGGMFMFIPIWIIGFLSAIAGLVLFLSGEGKPKAKETSAVEYATRIPGSMPTRFVVTGPWLPTITSRLTLSEVTYDAKKKELSYGPWVPAETLFPPTFRLFFADATQSFPAREARKAIASGDVQGVAICQGDEATREYFIELAQIGHFVVLPRAACPEKPSWAQACTHSGCDEMRVPRTIAGSPSPPDGPLLLSMVTHDRDKGVITHGEWVTPDSFFSPNFTLVYVTDRDGFPAQMIREAKPGAVAGAALCEGEAVTEKRLAEAMELLAVFVVPKKHCPSHEDTWACTKDGCQ